MNQWINEIFQNSKRVAVPVMTHPGIELTGHRVIEAVTDGRVHYEAIKYLADHYPSFATSTIMDLTVEAEAFGCQINFPEDEVPSVVADWSVMQTPWQPCRFPICRQDGYPNT